MTVNAQSPEFHQLLTDLRHYIHQHPEISNQEVQTTKWIKENLAKWGIKIIPSTLHTGVIAEIGDASKGPLIALRSDIDALPIQEETGLDYHSVNDGAMHACGHDFHQASLLGAAYLLKQEEAQIPGLIRLIFQPAEETHNGAQQVIDAGHLKGVQAIIGYHNNPNLKPGEIGIRKHGLMAAVDQFAVHIKGVGTHAAAPHLGSDPIVTATTIINELQTVVSRNLAPLDVAVVSVTHIESGNTWNVLPDTAFFEGTIRTFSEKARTVAKKHFYDIVQNTAKAFEQTVEITWDKATQVVDNDPKLTEIVADETKNFADVVDVDPSNAGEDFAVFQQHVPGVFVFIGSNGEPGAPDWHHNNFTVKDEGLPFASLYYERNALRLLKELK